MIKDIEYDALALNIVGDLLITSDNSGAIGEKEFDKVKVPYETVAYYLFRVVFMECVAAGGQPQSLILQNFNGDKAWSSLMSGLEKGMREINYPNLSITGSSESNFELKQSATNLTMLGQVNQKDQQEWCEEKLKKDYEIALIGKPLVGEELLEQTSDIANLAGFYWLSQQEEVLALIPVASKGIQSALAKIQKELFIQFNSDLDLEKSAGPATCYLVIYQKDFYQKMTNQLTAPIFKGKW